MSACHHSEHASVKVREDMIGGGADNKRMWWHHNDRKNWELGRKLRKLVVKKYGR